MQVALQNARALSGDARVLLEAESWPRAAALAILAIEEAAKIGILRGLLLARSNEELRSGWRDFRRHTAKNYMANFLEYARPGAKLDDLRALVIEAGGHEDIERLKQAGLYSNCLAPETWTSPNEIIDEDVARALVATASTIVGPERAMTTPQELEIWVKHLQPVWGSTTTAVREALAVCYREAATKGVLRGDAPPASMSEFLDLPIDADASD